MDWDAAAEAFLRVWRETGLGTYGVWGGLALTVAVLTWKALDAWGRRQSK